MKICPQLSILLVELPDPTWRARYARLARGEELRKSQALEKHQKGEGYADRSSATLPLCFQRSLTP